MMGGTSSSARFLYHGFVNTSGNSNTVVLEPIYNTNTGITFVASFPVNPSGGYKIKIEASGTVYGGIRLIWLS